MERRRRRDRDATGRIRRVARRLARESTGQRTRRNVANDHRARSLRASGDRAAARLRTRLNNGMARTARTTRSPATRVGVTGPFETRGDARGERAEGDDDRSNRGSGEPVQTHGPRGRNIVRDRVADPIWASGHCAASTGRTHERSRSAVKIRINALEPKGPSTHDSEVDP